MNSLDDPKVRGVLDQLHRQARRDWLFFLTHLPTVVPLVFGRGGPTAEEQARTFKDVFIPLSRLQGRFLYLVARSKN